MAGLSPQFRGCISGGGVEEARGRNQQILLCLAFLARLALAQLLYKKSISK